MKVKKLALAIPGLQDLTEAETTTVNGGVNGYEMMFNAGVWTLGYFGGPWGAGLAGAITTSGVYSSIVNGLASALTPVFSIYYGK